MARSDTDLPLTGEIGFDTKNGGHLTLKFGTKAMVEVERRLKKPVTEVAAEMGAGNVYLEHLLVMFHCALLHQDKSITEDRAADLMDEIGPGKAVDLVGQAFSAAWPQDGDGDEDGEEAAQEGSGGPTGAKTGRKGKK